MYYLIKVWCIILLSINVVQIQAAPICTVLGELQKDVLCTPGSEDYVLKKGLVSDNNRTTGITLKACRISRIEFESLHGLPSLEYLDLSMNKIKTIRLGALDGAKQVTYLNLSYNSLVDFDLGLFDQKPNLEVLDLRGNKIITIKLGLFDPLKLLRHLDLSANNILGRDLNPYIFDKSRKIKFLDFSRNDMSGTPDNLLHAFQELDFLNLDRCFLQDVPKFLTRNNMRTMKHLIISTNQIKRLDNPATFINLDSLEILDLTANEIDMVNENIFKPLKRLKRLILRDNMLKNIPDTLFQNMAKLGHVDLFHNRLEEVPVNAFRGTAVKTLNLAHNRFTYLQDNFYLELKNSGVRITRFYFNDNPWQCACLNDLLKELKINKVAYNAAKYEGKVPVCVTTKEFSCKRQQSFNELYFEIYDKSVLNKN